MVTAVKKVMDEGIQAQNVHSAYKDDGNLNDFSDMPILSCVRAADV